MEQLKDTPSYRDARTHLKTRKKWRKGLQLTVGGGGYPPPPDHLVHLKCTGCANGTLIWFILGPTEVKNGVTRPMMHPRQCAIGGVQRAVVAAVVMKGVAVVVLVVVGESHRMILCLKIFHF